MGPISVIPTNYIFRSVSDDGKREHSQRPAQERLEDDSNLLHADRSDRTVASARGPPGYEQAHANGVTLQIKAIAVRQNPMHQAHSDSEEVKGGSPPAARNQDYSSTQRTSRGNLLFTGKR